MQDGLQTAYPNLKIQILGVNKFDSASGNASVTTGRDLPWLQDVDNNHDGTSDVWQQWNVAEWDVVILDAANKKVDTYNLAQHDLATSQYFNALRQKLVDAASAKPPWQNPDNALDVNDDGAISPVGDVLVVINELNSHVVSDQLGHLPIPPVAPHVPPPFYDVNGDNYVSPVGDVLPLINFLNSQVAGEGEGTASAALADSGTNSLLASAPANVSSRLARVSDPAETADRRSQSAFLDRPVEADSLLPSAQASVPSLAQQSPALPAGGPLRHAVGQQLWPAEAAPLVAYAAAPTTHRHTAVEKVAVEENLLANSLVEQLAHDLAPVWYGRSG